MGNNRILPAASMAETISLFNNFATHNFAAQRRHPTPSPKDPPDYAILPARF